MGVDQGCGCFISTFFSFLNRNGCTEVMDCPWPIWTTYAKHCLRQQSHRHLLISDTTAFAFWFSLPMCKVGHSQRDEVIKSFLKCSSNVRRNACSTWSRRQRRCHPKNCFVVDFHTPWVTASCCRVVQSPAANHLDVNAQCDCFSSGPVGQHRFRTMPLWANLA